MIGNRGASNNDGGELCWSEAVPSNPLKFMGTSERDDQEADRVLSGELLKLSFDERNKINEEMHGVRDDFPEFKEHPEATELSLLDMDCEIESILLNSEKNKCAGLQLEHIPTNREFRLAFLRCELHDATKAAHRLVRYIRLIRERCSCRGGVGGCACGCIEGGENGGRIVATKWFTKEEYSVMKKGVIQLMPYRDRSGRRVVIPLSACFKLPIAMRVRFDVVETILNGCCMPSLFPQSICLFIFWFVYCLSHFFVPRSLFDIAA
jgi:hypothetical protein